MFDSLKKFINEFERIVDKINTAGEFTDEEKSFLEYADILLALALLETDGCDIRKVAKNDFGRNGRLVKMYIKKISMFFEGGDNLDL